MTARQAIDEMVRRIVALFNPDKVILFGSQARGDAGPASDVDLAVVLPILGSKRKKRIEVRVALHDIEVANDVVLLTPDELSRFKDIPGTISCEVNREGKVLYERPH